MKYKNIQFSKKTKLFDTLNQAEIDSALGEENLIKSLVKGIGIYQSPGKHFHNLTKILTMPYLCVFFKKHPFY